jgi:hypothetical protein
MLSRVHRSALALCASETGGGARIDIKSRDQAVWPVDCRYMSTDVLARRNPFPQDARIQFVESTHKYYIDGREAPVSVTSFVHAPFPPFETRDVIASMSQRTRDAKYKGLSDKEIARSWALNAQEASQLGTCMHAAMEVYLNTGYLSTDPRIKRESEMIRDFVQRELTDKGIEVYRTEPTIFADDPDTGLLLPGSVDCIIYDPVAKEYGVLDWKRSKEIVMTANGRYGFGEGPFGSLENTNFFQYSLQLHTYSYILRQYYGLNVNPARLYMVVIHPNYDSYQMIPAADVGHLVSTELFKDPQRYVKMAQEHKKMEEDTNTWRAT